MRAHRRGPRECIQRSCRWHHDVFFAASSVGGGRVLAGIQASFAVPIALSFDFGSPVRGSDGETVAGEASQTSGHSVT